MGVQGEGARPRANHGQFQHKAFNIIFVMHRQKNIYIVIMKKIRCTPMMCVKTRDELSI